MVAEFYYRFDSLTPKEGPHSNCNFNAYLKGDLARKAFEQKLNENFYKTLQEDGGKLIKLNFKEKNFCPYKFAENKEGNLTMLLRGIFVPEDACDLSIDGGYYSNIVANPEMWLTDSLSLRYVPHNIDNQLQANTTLILWLEWANCLSWLVE
jgi:hypothetical protein